MFTVPLEYKNSYTHTIIVVYCQYVLYVVSLLIMHLYSRRPHSVPKLFFRRQPWLPGGQGGTTAQLCTYWTVYWLTDPTPSAKYYPPDNYSLLQRPLGEQARVQANLSGWVHLWFWLIMIKDTKVHKIKKEALLFQVKVALIWIHTCIQIEPTI